REEEDAHDALAVHLAPIARDAHVRLEARRQVNELGRRARVHSQLVDDRYGTGGHNTRNAPRDPRGPRSGCAPQVALFSPRRKSDATHIALRPCSRISFATASRSDE